MTVAVESPRPVMLGRFILTVLAAVLWALGWSAGKTWAAVTWVAAAVLIGWSDSRATPRRR